MQVAAAAEALLFHLSSGKRQRRCFLCLTAAAGAQVVFKVAVGIFFKKHFQVAGAQLWSGVTVIDGK